MVERDGRGKHNSVLDYEKEMEKVTVPAGNREIAVSPEVLSRILEEHSREYCDYMDSASDMAMEKWDQIDRLKLIAARKLRGRTREIVLVLLNTGLSRRAISEILHISRNGLQDELDRAIEVFREHMKNRPESPFPSRSGQRFRSIVFSVDTEDEQNKFQEFINGDRAVHSLSYCRNGDFREVLAIYSDREE